MDEKEATIDSTPVISAEMCTPTLDDTVTNSDLDCEENICEQLNSAPKRSYQTRGRRKSEVNGEAIATPSKKAKKVMKIAKTPLQTRKAKKEIEDLRSENTALNRAVKLLEETVLKQGNQITDLYSKIDGMKSECIKEIDQQVNIAESRLHIFHNNQEAKCLELKKQVSAAFNKRMDKISTKIDVVEKKMGENPVPEIPSDTIHSQLSDLQTYIEKVDHEVASMQDSMSKLVDNDISFTVVTPPKSRNTGKDDNVLKVPLKSGPWHAEDPLSPAFVCNEEEDKDTASTEQAVECVNNGNNTGEEEHRTLQDKRPRKNDDAAKGKETRKVFNSVLFIDSNAAHLDRDLLWKNNNIIRCGTTYDVRNKLKSMDLSDMDLVFIHVGVNDIDTENGAKVATNLVDLVRGLKRKYPSLKIVVSEVTPRQLHRDDEVIECNKILHATLRFDKEVTIAKHGNLRNERWSFHKKNDDKHFSEISIARFASNLKTAFRTAIGLSNTQKKGRKQSEGPRNGKDSNKEIRELKNMLLKFLKNN